MSAPGPGRERPLRVLHGTYEIAGQGMMLAHALREQGCDARAFSYRVDWDGRVSDIVVDLDARRGLARRGMAMAGAFARWSRRFDVFHLHFGTSFLPRLLDVPWLRAQNRLVVFHFHGCEIRDRAHMLRTHALSTCTDCDPFCRPRHQRWLRDRARAWADRIFYSTLDLAESVPGGEHLPLAIETRRWTEAAALNPLPDFDRRDGVRGPVVVGHAPTNRLIKGTRHVYAAVEGLRREFPRLELRLIERRPWAEMPAFLAGCDILVDQLHMGWYGLLAIEGMAERKAVIACLRDDFRPGWPDLPVVDARPESLVEVLRGLIRDPARRAGLGEQGEVFARRVHDTAAVGARLLAAYRAAMAAHAPRPRRAAAEGGAP
jgi:hypothetical protein